MNSDSSTTKIAAITGMASLVLGAIGYDYLKQRSEEANKIKKLEERKENKRKKVQDRLLQKFIS